MQRSKNEDIWRLAVKIEQVDPRFIRFLIATEDKRFTSHYGFDPWALGRAVWQLLRYGRVVSGASTITMQTVRLLEPRPRTVISKIIEFFRAIQLERHFSKQQILEMYLTLTPYGGNLEGVKTASQAYFRHSPQHLSVAQAALLVTIPKSPNQLRPDRFPEKALRARNRTLKNLFRQKAITHEELKLAWSKNVPLKRINFPTQIPHLARRLITAEPKLHEHQTYIDHKIQYAMEKIAQNASQNVLSSNIAIIVIDHKSSEIKAYVGSREFRSNFHHGQVDFIQAIRSPGSSLKPFIYGIGFEQGYITPETILKDTRKNYGAYTPTNFDKNYQGDVSVKDALQLSLNIPVLGVLEAVGPFRFWNQLEQSGVALKMPRGHYKIPSIAIGLGGLGMNLEGLAILYSSLMNKGRIKPVKLSQTIKLGQEHRILSAAAASQIIEILQADQYDGQAVAFKTGTSYGHRDVWALGVNNRYTVGIWMGCHDGAAMRGATGNSLAVPVLMKAFGALPIDNSPWILEKTPSPALLNIYHSEGKLKPHLEFIFPVNDSVVVLNRNEAGVPSKVPLLITNHTGELTWLINGELGLVTKEHDKYQWQPRDPGFYKITAIDEQGARAQVEIKVT